MPTPVSAEETHASTSSGGIPAFRGPNAISSATVGMNNWSSGSWKTIPITRRT
jgi:hypothetical protein